MSRWTPCKRRIFIQKLKKLGFKDPETGGRHEFMLYGSYKQTIPNNDEFSVPQLKKTNKTSPTKDWKRDYFG